MLTSSQKQWGILLCLLIWCSASLAQNPLKEGEEINDKPLPNGFSLFSVDVGGGFALFHGDVALYDRVPSPGDFDKSAAFAWSASINREFKWGLLAQLQYSQGSLKGERGQVLDPDAHFFFEGQYFDWSFIANYDLAEALLNRRKRWSVYGQVGIGMVYFRSQYIQTNSGIRKGWAGYIPLEGSNGQLLLDKADPETSIMVPVGVQFLYRINFKTDLWTGITLRNTDTDMMDSWSRNWSSPDKYSYWSAGLRFNFNRTRSEHAVVKTTKKKKNKNSGAMSVGNIGGGAPSGNTGGGGKFSIFGGGKRQAAPAGGGGQSDDLLELRLKLFETQLKLFEMQYLLNK